MNRWAQLWRSAALLLSFAVGLFIILYDRRITAILMGFAASKSTLIPYLAPTNMVLTGFIIVVLASCLGYEKPLHSAPITAEIGIAGGWALLLSQIAQSLWVRQRPFIELASDPLISHSLKNGAFPSDYALLCAVACSTIVQVNRSLGVMCWIITIMICILRVSAGLHWATDVLAGTLLGGIIPWLVSRAQAGKKFLDPYSGIYYLTFAARLTIPLAVIYSSLPISSELTVLGPKERSVMASIFYAIGTLIFYRMWLPKLRVLEGSDSDLTKQDSFVPQQSGLIWTQIVFDLLYFTSVYAFSGDLNSTFFLFLLICTMYSLLLRSPANSLRVFFLTLLSLGISLIVIQHSKGTPAEAINYRQLLAVTVLPRLFTLFAGYAIVAWVLFRDRKLIELMANVGSSEAFLRSLIQNVPHYIYRIDLRGRFTYVNQNFAELAGLSQDACVNKTADDLYPRHLALKYTADDVRVMASGQALVQVEKHKPWNKTEISVQVIKRALKDERGTIVGLQGVFWDISSIKEAEERLKEESRRLSLDTLAARSKLAATEEELKIKQRILDGLLSLTGEIVYTHNLDGKFTSLNPAGQELVGYTEDEFLRMKIEDVVAPDHLERARAKMADKLREASIGKRVTSYTLDVISKSKQRIPLEVSTRILLSGGRPSEVYGIARSLVIRGQAASLAVEELEIQMSRFMEMRKESESIKDEQLSQSRQLLRDVHHRVRNNLQIMVALIDEALERAKTVDKQNIITALEKTRLRLSDMELIHDLLYQSEAPSSIKMSAYLVRLVDLISKTYSASDRCVKMTCDCASIELPTQIAGSIGVVVHELTSNAIKHAFTNVPGGYIQVELVEVSPEQLLLRVSDNGKGFSKNKLAEGSGLQFTQLLIKRFKGIMNVTTESGTRIDITFPKQ